MTAYICTMKFKVYHNPRCSKSRNVIQWLADNDAKFEVVTYMNTPLSKDELKEVSLLLDQPVDEMIRKDEDVYKSLILNKNLSDEEKLDVLSKHPKLIERPIVVWDNKAVIARPLELLIESIKQVQHENEVH